MNPPVILVPVGREGDEAVGIAVLAGNLPVLAESANKFVVPDKSAACPILNELVDKDSCNLKTKSPPIIATVIFFSNKLEAGV